MTVLVLTIVGDDRAGLVASVSRTIADHGGNWERSELAELAGTFAGVVEVVVPDAAAAGLRGALAALEGALTVTVHENRDAAERAGVELTFTVLGNDSPGIVRELSGALEAHGLSIDHLSTETRDAAMAGGRLFEATFTARMPAGRDAGDVRDALESVAAELQVDVTVS
ncbi:glycine cleavage system protein R [Microbacterium xanthum]|uniref:glycine cleavage system protein R n=1 Tax=Microbacterium xanthum TaxID=3079794 RepID=UPI002AD4AF9A|nr:MULTISPECIES: ACT domain-containing protein [unclassified Microbacterium]MDZ8171481.1 ACT domain-containing protein [Microbacterium sp. KSW-48]MDZ8200479.1 ACT domain-containing protein [Microbacterium sp. SSW1-59]